MRAANRQRKAAMLGLGFDADDGQTRITKGDNFLLYGGSQETHAVMQETAVKINEHLDRRGQSWKMSPRANSTASPATSGANRRQKVIAAGLQLILVGLSDTAVVRLLIAPAWLISNPSLPSAPVRSRRPTCRAESSPASASHRSPLRVVAMFHQYTWPPHGKNHGDRKGW